MAALVSARASLGRCYVFCLASTLATLTGGCNAVFGIHEGTPRPPCYDPGPSPLLIDDMEDGVGDICNLGGRQGIWYTLGDGTEGTLSPAQGATFTPAMIPGGRGSSHYAARFTGSGFTGFGALMGFNLDTAGLTTQPYNASSTGGITFWMKNNVPVSVNFLIPDTVVQAAGGNCVTSATDPNCNSHFSFQITAPNADWAHYFVPFAALVQQYGGTATWNPQQLLGFQFLVGAGAAFDVWVDDISFYYCSTAACVPTCTDPVFTLSCPAGANYPAACRAAGADCTAAAKWCADPLMIDDMEDGNGVICDSGGRHGSWFTYAVGTEGTVSPAQGAVFTMTPIPGGRGASQMAAHMTASGFSPFAQMGLVLNQSVPGVAGPYDASPTSGITFWMKATAPYVEVSLPISKTVPVSRGGLCSDSTTTFNCDNDFSFVITSPSDDWFQYYVPYSALSQPIANPDANGNSIVGSATWDPTSLTNVLFSAGQPANVDLWIDDLSFYDDCSGASCVPTCSDPGAPVACPASGGIPAGCWPTGTDCAHPPDFTLTSPWGSGSDDVWAVGFTGAAGAGVIRHWNGAVWSSSSSGVTSPLWGVWSSAVDDVWAVGDFGAVVHWDGGAWTSSTPITMASLSSVWGSGANDVWAAGANGTILQFDGTTWSVSANISSKILYRLSGSGPDDVWAVGDAGTILHYDGASWTASASGTDSILWGVWSAGPSDAWAVGNTTGGDATILHFDGTAWSPAGTPAAPFPNAVWGSGPSDVWVVGESILHFDGTAWSPVPSPTGAYLYSVWGTGPSDAWIVGASGTILHWNGTIWSVVPTAGTQ